MDHLGSYTDFTFTLGVKFLRVLVLVTPQKIYIPTSGTAFLEIQRKVSLKCQNFVEES